MDSGNIYTVPQNAKSDENVERGGRRCYCACVHPSLSLCMCVDAFVHVSACIFIVHAGPEAAVLDCYDPEADPGYWQGSKGDSR